MVFSLWRVQTVRRLELEVLIHHHGVCAHELWDLSRYLFSVRFRRPAGNPHVCVSASAHNGSASSKCCDTKCARARVRMS